MSDRQPTPAIVAYVGNGSLVDPEGRIRVEHVDGGFTAEYAAYADCVVLEEPGGGRRALEAIDELAVPTILYDRTADPRVAAEAARVGVTEYVTEGSLEDETLVDLALAAVEREPRANRSATETSELPPLDDQTQSFEETSERLFEIGRQRLGLEIGALAVIDKNEYTVVAGDESAVDSGISLSETLCRLTVRTDDAVTLPDTAWGPPIDELANPFDRLKSYIGDDFVVGGDRYGTVWFGSERTRQAFSTAERAFFQRLVDRFRAEIEGRRAPDEEASELAHRVAEPLASDGSGDAGVDSQASMTEPPDDPGVGVTKKTPRDAETTDREPPSRVSPGGELTADRGGSAETADSGRFRKLFDQLPDAVVDIEFREGKPIVRKVNEAFEETFGYDETAAIGRPLDDLIVPAEEKTGTGRVDETIIRDGDGTAEVERLSIEGRNTYLFRGFSYHQGETERGFGIYTDIAGRLEQERQLRVLHRVLRHNLRNEMTAVIGYAEMLAEEGTDPIDRKFARKIYEEATDVSKLGEQVRRIEQALDVDRQQVSIDPEPLTRKLAEQFSEQHPEATVRVSADESTKVVADELLETAIDNLIENAIEHHPGNPTVEIELSAVNETWFDITVRDDGPGIPERERAIVSGDREITQLDHSRGLGLWVSRWVVRGVDGRLLFGDRKTGAEVTLRLRRADRGTVE
jgi:PAS domain S-box-containing protein